MSADRPMDARVHGPLPGEPFLPVGALELGSAGYVREEWFLEGSAHAYALSGARRADGRWQAIAPASRAPFKTRIVVYRPEDPLTLQRHRRRRVVQRERRRRRSARLVLPAPPPDARRALPGWACRCRRPASTAAAWCRACRSRRPTPSATAPSSIPGDAFAFDIYSAVGRALRTPGSGPLGPPRGAARDRDRRVAVRGLPGHLRQRRRSHRALLRRLPDPRPPRRGGRSGRRLPPRSARRRPREPERDRRGRATESARTSASPCSPSRARPTS